MKIRHIPSIHQRRKKRVAAYCRVSTDMKSQEESFETQVSYYQRYIERNDEWVLVGIYADGGVSATGAAKRPEFMRMIADAMEGKIDLILVKSISRFSRNVVDCQVYVQQLRSNGCRNNFIREEELLRKVSDQLGWEWKGADDFDAEQFNALVQAVYVENGEVSVRRLARRVSA